MQLVSRLTLYLLFVTIMYVAGQHIIRAVDVKTKVVQSIGMLYVVIRSIINDRRQPTFLSTRTYGYWFIRISRDVIHSS